MIKELKTKKYGIVEIEMPFDECELVARKKEFYGQDYNPRKPHYEFYAQFTNGFTAEDLKIDKRQTKDRFISLYGWDEGTRRYDEYRNKMRKRGTLSWFQDKYGEDEGTRRYEEKNKKLSVGVESLGLGGHSDEEIERIREIHSKKSALTLENYICKYGKDLGYIKYAEMVSNRVSCYMKKYWTERGFTEEEAEKEISNIQRRDKTFFIKKYGKEIGHRRFMEMCARRSFSLSRDGFLERYGETEGETLWQIYNKLKRMDLNGFIRVHGEKQGKKKHKERNDLIKNTYEKFVRVHGKNADVKWSEYLVKLADHLKTVSKRSIVEMECIDSLQTDLCVTISTDNKFFLYSDEMAKLGQRIILPDGVIREHKVVIEFDGDAVHGNPKFYTNEQKNMFGTLYEDMWEKDRLKDEIYRKRGYVVLRIWEDDYHNKYQDVVKRLDNILKRNKK